MRRVTSPLFLMAVLAVSTIPLSAAEIEPQPVDGKIKWVYSYAEGKRLGQETGKPLFVVFRCER